MPKQQQFINSSKKTLKKYGTAIGVALLLLIYINYRKRQKAAQTQKQQAEQYVAACAASVGKLNATQQDSIRLIAEVFAEEGDGDQNKLAYIFATAWHEASFIPKEERRAGTNQPKLRATQDRYWGTGYYGRGFVQMTWASNYEEMSELLGVDFLNKPELALVPHHAARLLVLGMLGGHYGTRLDKHINEQKIDFYNARRTVNGLDKAATIATTARKILDHLNQA
jgi:predicted chitinase